MPAAGSSSLVIVRRVAVAVAALTGFLAGPAFGEKADRDKPMNIEADRVFIDDAKKISTFEGNVVVTQGTLTMRSDRMVVKQDASGFNQGTAYGNRASFRQKREGVDEWVEGYAERIEYDTRAEKVQLFNKAELRRGGDEVKGNYIAYDQATEFFQVTGGGKPAATGNNPEGRVRMMIMPKPKPGAPPPPAAAPVTLKPAAGVANPRD